MNKSVASWTRATMKPLDRIVRTNGAKNSERVGIFFSEPLIVQNLKYFSVRFPSNPKSLYRFSFSPSLRNFSDYQINKAKYQIKLRVVRGSCVSFSPMPSGASSVKYLAGILPSVSLETPHAQFDRTCARAQAHSRAVLCLALITTKTSISLECGSTFK